LSWERSKTVTTRYNKRVLLYLGKVLVIQTLEERHLAQLFAGRLYVHERACKVEALLLPVNQMNDLFYFCFIHQTCMKQ